MDYKRVIKDFANGTIDPNKWTLVIDNDSGYWEYNDPEVGSDEELKEISEQKEDEFYNNTDYGSQGGYKDIVDVLNAAGVNARWC